MNASLITIASWISGLILSTLKTLISVPSNKAVLGLRYQQNVFFTKVLNKYFFELFKMFWYFFAAAGRASFGNWPSHCETHGRDSVNPIHPSSYFIISTSKPNPFKPSECTFHTNQHISHQQFLPTYRKFARNMGNKTKLKHNSNIQAYINTWVWTYQPLISWSYYRLNKVFEFQAGPTIPI